MDDEKDLTNQSENADKPKRKPRAKRSKKATTPLPALPPASTPSPAGAYKVQVFYLAARNTNPRAPVKDALWFATYPIIPRVGDCLFHDGIYYQVERVFLYENMGPGWYADIEVIFYGRR
ncbi:MAG: hypothetical protein AAGH78_16900 [Cyanobacteria bacterium P01_H01_bin.58]